MKEVENKGLKWLALVDFEDGDEIAEYFETRQEAEEYVRGEQHKDCLYAYVCRIETMWEKE